MAPFDRPYATFYWSAIVNIALSSTVCELFDVEYYRDLEMWVRGHSRSLKVVPFESCVESLCWNCDFVKLFISIFMYLICIVCILLSAANGVINDDSCILYRLRVI